MNFPKTWSKLFMLKAVLLVLGLSSITGCIDVATDSPVGFIDRSGKEVIPRQFDSAQDFSEGLAGVSVKGQWGFIDSKGKIVIAPEYNLVDRFSDGYAAVAVKDKWGYIDKKGKLVILPQYQFAGAFSEGIAPTVVWESQTEGCTFIDKTGKVVIKKKGLGVDSEGPPFGPGVGFSDGLIPVFDPKNNLGGYLSNKGELVIKPMFDQARSFSEGLAPVQKNGYWGFIDKTGKWIIEPKFQDARAFGDGVAPVGRKGKWQFIDKKGNPAFDGTFDSALPFSEGVARVSNESHKGWIDRQGTWLNDQSCGSLHEGLAICPSHTWADQVGRNNVRIMAMYAIREIPEGQTIKEGDLEGREVGAKGLADNAVTSFEALIGKKARHKIGQGELFVSDAVN